MTLVFSARQFQRERHNDNLVICSSCPLLLTRLFVEKISKMMYFKCNHCDASLCKCMSVCMYKGKDNVIISFISAAHDNVYSTKSILFPNHRVTVNVSSLFVFYTVEALGI